MIMVMLQDHAVTMLYQLHHDESWWCYKITPWACCTNYTMMNHGDVTRSRIEHVVSTPQFIVVLLQDHAVTMLYQLHHDESWCYYKITPWACCTNTTIHCGVHWGDWGEVTTSW